MESRLHTIKTVVRKTGLSPHIIRTWERRYGAVSPSRTDTNRRLYEEEDVRRLELLRDATREGYSIGQIATLPTEELQQLLRSDLKKSWNRGSPSGFGGGTASRPVGSPSSLIDSALDRVSQLDGAGLSGLLDSASVELGQSGLIHRFLAPLIREIGEAWRTGRFSIAQEHLATSVIRGFLDSVIRPASLPGNAPLVICTTPAGQVHELGAALAAAVASQVGWRVAYLGPSLPADEIAGGVAKLHADAVALSLVYPMDDPDLPAELRRLRKLLGNRVPIIVGGRASDTYEHALREIEAIRVSGLHEFQDCLDRIRR